MKSLVSCLAGLVLVLGVTQVGHASFILTISQFTGDPASAKVTVQDNNDDGTIAVGDIKFTIDNIIPSPSDIRGFWFDILMDSLLEGLSIINVSATGVIPNPATLINPTFGPAGTVNNLGGGNNLNGGGTPAPFDIGLDIGTPGIGTDDVNSLIFTLHHSTLPLTLDEFTGQDIGIRMTSVPNPTNREGSSKLGSLLATPEPSTLILLSITIAVILGIGYRQRKKAA